MSGNYNDASRARQELEQLRALVHTATAPRPEAQQLALRVLWRKLESVLLEIIAYVEANRR